MTYLPKYPHFDPTSFVLVNELLLVLFGPPRHGEFEEFPILSSGEVKRNVSKRTRAILKKWGKKSRRK